MTGLGVDPLPGTVEVARKRKPMIAKQDQSSAATVPLGENLEEINRRAVEAIKRHGDI